MENLSSVGLLILRLGVAALMIPHAISKILMLINGNAGSFLNPIGIGAIPSIWLAIFAELLCSILIACGFFTRIAAFFLAINMCVICYYWLKEAGGWSSNLELPLLYLTVYVTLILVGAGKLSLEEI